MKDREYKEVQDALSSHMKDEGISDQFRYGILYAKSVISGIHRRWENAPEDYEPEFDWKNIKSCKPYEEFKKTGDYKCN